MSRRPTDPLDDTPTIPLLEAISLEAVIQTAGRLAGVPMVAIRVVAPGVATAYSPHALAAVCRVLHPGPRWALILGALDGYNLAPFIAALQGHGYKVAVAGNGCTAAPGADLFSVQGISGANLDIVKTAHELRFLIAHPIDVDGVLAVLGRLNARYGRDWRIPDVVLLPLTPEGIPVAERAAVAHGWRVAVTGAHPCGRLIVVDRDGRGIEAPSKGHP